MLLIKEIIEQGEGETLEFKPSFNQDVIETSAAFANTLGGMVLIGGSNDGEGLGSSFAREALRVFVNRISNATEPSVSPNAEKVQFDGGDVVVLRVPEYPMKPISVRGRCFKRSGSTTRQMMPSEVAEVHLQCTGQSADALFVDGKTVEDLDMDQVRLYIARAINSGRRSFSRSDDPIIILEKLELIRGECDVTRAALFLFGKNPQSPFTQSVVHAGKIRGAVDIMDDRFIRGSIIDQVEESLDFIKKHINVQSVITGKSQRDDVWDYPLDALREALTNAVCHRDYCDLGDIQIKVYDQSLQIWSPGFLPFGMTVEELLRSNHSSKPRNRLIAQVFYDMGMIEQYGSGIKRVVDACVEAGLPRPEFENFSGGFQIVFPIMPAGKVGDAVQIGEQVSEQVGEQDGEQVKLALRVLLLGEKGKVELLDALGFSGVYLNYKRYIIPLVEKGLVEMTLPDKPTSRLQRYRLTGKGRQFLGDVVTQKGEQDDEQVGEQVKLALRVLLSGKKDKVELLDAMGFSGFYLNYKRHIVPLVEKGLVEMTLPDKPTSRLQRYRLTEMGRRVMERKNEIDL